MFEKERRQPMAMQALVGVKVIEYGELVAVPYAGKLLADLGAEVIKVERPGGDAARDLGPFPGDVPHPEKSGLFLYLNTNKRGVTLDLRTPTGQKLFRELVKGADILLAAHTVQQVHELGLRYEDFKALNPELVMLSLTPFGMTGPYAEYKGYGSNCAALGGMVISLGEADREPLIPPAFVTEFFTGLCAATAALAALEATAQEGEGEFIDLSETDTTATVQTGMGFAQYLFSGRVSMRHGRDQIGLPYANKIFPCKDGDFRVMTVTKLEWRRFLELMGNPEWGNDPRFQDRIKMRDLYAAELDALIIPWLMQYTKQELFQMAYDAKLPFCPLKNVAEVAHEPQLVARDFFVPIAHPVAGTYKYPGAPYKLSKTPWQVTRSAPLLGEHNAEVFCEGLGYSKEDLVQFRRTGVV